MSDARNEQTEKRMAQNSMLDFTCFLPNVYASVRLLLHKSVALSVRCSICPSISPSITFFRCQKTLGFDHARIMLSYIAKVIWKELVVALGYHNCCLLEKMNASISHHFNQQCIPPSVVLNAKTKSNDGDFHLRP